MNEVYLLLTALMIVGSLVISYRRTGDPMSPLVIFAPMLLYVYVYRPYVIVTGTEVKQFFTRPEDIEYILLVSMVSVAAFCFGASHFRKSAGDDEVFRILEQDASPAVRKRFLNLSLVLGTLGFASFWWLVYQSGGPIRMWKQAKPHFAYASGYIGEMPMLTYPALLLMAAAWQRRRLTMGRFLIASYIACPQVAWAVIGKRRGTIFLIAATLAACWFLMKNKKPNWKVIIGGVGMLGLFLLFVLAQRNALAQTGVGVDAPEVVDILTEGDEFVAAGATILTSEKHNHHFWGMRVFATFIVRPIPAFFWKNKWKDMGLGWMETQPGLSGLTTSQWVDAIGFDPARGTAGGFVADAFLEWSWGGAIACYFLGFAFSWLWKQWVSRGGVWTALYIESLILSIFLPSQSLGAWAYRFMLLAAPTVFVFRLLLPKAIRRQTFSPPTQLAVPLRTS